MDMMGETNRRNGSGCEKISTTYLDPSEKEYPSLVTPTSLQPIPQTVTPGSVSYSRCSQDGLACDESPLGVLPMDSIRSDQSQQTLEDLDKAMKLVKRILDRTISEGDGTDPSLSPSDDLQLLHMISNRLNGLLGSDLLALVNAVSMVREFAGHAAEEASELVSDIHEANIENQASKRQAQQAKDLGRKLYKENLALRNEVNKLRQDRQALIAEVKSLRRDANETRKYDAWRLLEQHVVDSMAIHESVLRSPTYSTSHGEHYHDVMPVHQQKLLVERFQESMHVSSEGDEEVCVQPRFRGRLAGIRSAITGKVNSGIREKLTKAMTRKGRAQSSNSELSEEAENSTLTVEVTDSRLSDSARMATDVPGNSSTPSLVHEPWSHGKENVAEISPTVVDSIPEKRLFPSSTPRAVARPLVSPEASHKTPDFKPICDPGILRTLAIPTNESPSVRYSQSLSQEAFAGDNLYEC